MKKVQIKDGRTRVITINNKPSRTDKTQKDICDVNQIMKKFLKTGQITHTANRVGQYLDSYGIPDYQKSLEIVIAANNAFTELPSHIRKKFNNDPQELLKFLDDPKNSTEAIQLGLLKESNLKPDPTEAEKYYANQNAKEKKASKPDPKPDSQN